GAGAMKFLRALVGLAGFAFVAMFAYVAVMRIRIPADPSPLPPFVGAPSGFALRIVAIASTLITAACIWRMSRTHGGTRFWAWASVGIFFAGFALTGFSYDLDSSLSLGVALIAMAAVVTSEARGAVGAVLGGVLLGAACLLRSPAALLIV